MSAVEVLPAFPDLEEAPPEPYLYRVTGYFRSDPASVDNVATRVYRDDLTGTVIVSALMVARSRAQASNDARARGWLDPLIERFGVTKAAEPERGDEV